MSHANSVQRKKTRKVSTLKFILYCGLLQSLLNVSLSYLGHLWTKIFSFFQTSGTEKDVLRISQMFSFRRFFGLENILLRLKSVKCPNQLVYFHALGFGSDSQTSHGLVSHFTLQGSNSDRAATGTLQSTKCTTQWQHTTTRTLPHAEWVFMCFATTFLYEKRVIFYNL